MKRNHFFILILVTIGVVIILYSMQGGISPEEYAAKMRDAREEKERFMRNSEESPFANLEEEFKGLRYFDPDLKYRVTARLDRIEKPKLVQLPTSDAQTSQYLEYAYASFEIDGIACRLLILEVTEPGPNRGTLFLAFADETSTQETYGAGRYLDLKKNPGSSSIVLDFNEAYNPYCAYNATYSCPLPPRENLLEVAILAGEKTYQ